MHPRHVDLGLDQVGVGIVEENVDAALTVEDTAKFVIV